MTSTKSSKNYEDTSQQAYALGKGVENWHSTTGKLPNTSRLFPDTTQV